MKQRISTAAVLIAIFLPLAIWGGLPFLLLSYVMATVGLYELLHMRKLSIFSPYGIISLITLWIFMLPAENFEALNVTGLAKMEIIFVLLFIFIAYTVIVKNEFTFDDVGFVFVSILYVGIGFYYLFQTREVGFTYLLFALAVIWLTDSGAYFVGRKFGKHKLWPQISPNKTVEGFIGGIIMALLVALGFYLFADLPMETWELFIITIFLSIFGQLGDLAESALKRHYGVKDSGTLFPGHGGVLDRCDSWLFVLPLLNLLEVLL